MAVKIQNLDNWEDFENSLERLRADRDRLKTDRPTFISNLLYRGQSDSTWPLQTTLERYSGDNKYPLSDYYRKISVAKAQIETLTNKSWNIKTLPEFNNWLKDVDIIMNEPMPAYDYMIYLRHHGFPSPLLDWTQSPYIAAFFALDSAKSDA